MTISVPIAPRTFMQKLRPPSIPRAGPLFFVLGATLASGAGASAQDDPGRIVGTVVSGQTGEAIAGAHVSVVASSTTSLSNMDGRFILQGVTPGTHSVVVQVIGYARKTVTDVRVTAGSATMLDVSLVPEALRLDGITVSAAVERGNTAALLGERRKASVVMDAIGADQIARSPDGDAAAVLARAPGVSVVDDKYVLVRGLGDRYGAATLNGSPLPSPEPDRKVVPLHIVPSSFLESVVTAKTYSPDQPGDYAGGLVQIRTRNFPARQIVKLGASVAYNPEATGAHGLGYDGGTLDFLAMDDGSRDLPADLPDQRITSAAFATSELERLGEQFIGSWGPTGRNLPIDQGFTLAVGNEMSWFDGAVPTGYLVAANQSTSYGNQTDLVERVISSGGVADPEVDYGGTTTTRSASVGGMANFGIELTPRSRFTLSGIYNRSADDESRVLEGYNLDFSTNQRNTRIRYIEQDLISTQLKGEHELRFLNDTRVDWRADWSRARRYEPNTREVLYRQAPDGRYLFDTFVQSGSIFHSDLDESGYGGGVTVRTPFEFRGVPATLSFGGAADFKDREAYTRRFRFLPVGPIPESIREREPNDLFDETTIGTDGFRLEEATFPGDNYQADQSILAGFAMVEVDLLPRIRLSGGARLERAEQEVDPLSRFLGSSIAPSRARLENTDVLPGLNLTWEVAAESNVRIGFSRTLARPQFRELAPFQFTDYAGGFLTIGNPALERARITNYDVRWEWFPGLGSLVAVSGFYKRFDRPIESIVLSSTELIRTWVNAEGATNYGAELEARSSLGFLADALEPVGINANLTWVESRVTTGDAVTVLLPFGSGITELGVTDRDRPLQGQSPYVLNLGVNYASPTHGTTAAVLYNRFGRRIDTAGGSSLPDIYEEARDQLDLVLEQPFGIGLSAKLSARRLLGGEVEFTQGGETVRGFDLGRSLSISISWEPAGR